MSARLDTAPVYRIDDLAAPHLPALARVINCLPDAAAARLVPLEAAALARAARRRTGLADFGGDDYREPLALLCEDVRADDRITPLGRLTIRAILLQALVTRLCVQHAFTTARGRVLTPVAAPLVIVGLPRTGTTHLHNLLACVPALRFLPLWQSIAPFRPPGWRGRLPDLRRRQTAWRLRMIDHLLPRLRAMHAMEVDLPHEDLQLCAPAFRSFFFETSVDVPRYRAWYAGRQHPDAYAYLHRVLQLLQDGADGPRWVLKSPQHLDQLPALLSAFPDAVILRTQRDPARAALSLITMLLYTRRVLYRPFDVAAAARAWADRLAQMLRDGARQTAALPPAQRYDVDFERFMVDPVGTVEEILRFVGIGWDAPTRAAVTAYQQSAPPDRHGRIAYEAAAIGLDADELRERFAFLAA